jgi:hypothetical protein
MFGIKPLELILLIAVGYLIFDRFRNKAVTSNVTPLNGASGNTAPAIIKNYSEVGDNFDLQVEALMRNSGL